MKKRCTGTGMELLLLLTQQRYLYHQLDILTNIERELVEMNSPEALPKAISRRFELMEKLARLNDKLRSAKTASQALARQPGPAYEAQTDEIAGRRREIGGKTSPLVACETRPESATMPGLEI